MKKIVLLIGLIGISPIFAQQSENITTENSWFKAGLNVGLPTGDIADFASLTVGADVRGQHLVTPSFGIGIASGYNHFFGKDGASDIGLIPLAGLYLIALYCTKGEDEENDYGDKPVNSDIAEFIQDSKTSSTILISFLLWIFSSKIIWTFIVSSSERFYENPIYKYFNLFSNFIWMFIPIILSLSVRNYKWKIILLICSVGYMLYGFYEFVKVFIQSSNNFQF